MKPNDNDRTVESSGITESAEFGLSLKDDVFLMTILRSTLYTDKPLAVIREYSSNAWDAHRSVGKGELPIEVTVPTVNEPTLVIRDHGPGLSNHDVLRVYTQYGASTKRDSNTTVGMLGLGSKAGFSYSDSFTITSWFDGIKRIYAAVLGQDNKGAMNLIHSEVCDQQETGIEVSVGIRLEDIHEFTSKARNLFKHYIPRPKINIELPAPPTEQTILKHGAIVPSPEYGEAKWMALMGCVPYRINLDQLPVNEVHKCLHSVGGTLYFDIGDVKVSANREELEYAVNTKTALVNKFNDLIDEYVSASLAVLEDVDSKLTDWDKRLRVNVLNELNFPLPKEWEDYSQAHIKLTYDEEKLTIWHNKAACTRITINDETRLLIDDTGKNLVGYSLSQHDYVVRSKTLDVATLRSTLDKALEKAKLTGVGIALLSTLPFIAPPTKYRAAKNSKHRSRMFKLDADGGTGFAPPYSMYWETVVREAKPEDVFVIIKSFKVVGHNGFYQDLRADFKLAKQFGVTMPDIYGYKTTDKKPVDEAALKATRAIDYHTWRKKFVKSLLTPERLALLDEMSWLEPFGSWSSMPDVDERAFMKDKLGRDHPITDFYFRAYKATSSAKKFEGLKELAERNDVKMDKKSAQVALDALYTKYPLLTGDHLKMIYSRDRYNNKKDTRPHWLEYVSLIDAFRDKESMLASDLLADLDQTTISLITNIAMTA